MVLAGCVSQVLSRPHRLRQVELPHLPYPAGGFPGGEGQWLSVPRGIDPASGSGVTTILPQGAQPMLLKSFGLPVSPLRRTRRHRRGPWPSPAACGVRRQRARERPAPSLWLRRLALATHSSQSGVAPAGSGLATAVHIAKVRRTLSHGERGAGARCGSSTCHTPKLNPMRSGRQGSVAPGSGHRPKSTAPAAVPGPD